MQCLQLDMVPRMELTTGLSKTHGVKLGVKKDSSRLKEVLTCAVLQFVILSHKVLKKLILHFSFNDQIVKI